jgi:uracil-DNA glycosylase
VLAVGQYAQRYHLGAAVHRSLTETVAVWRDLLGRPVRPRVLPLPHPSWRNIAWLKRNPWFMAEVVPVLRAEIRRLLRDGK